MKRFVILLLSFAVVMLVGCACTYNDPSFDEIVTAYQEAGYSVWSDVYEKPHEFGITGYIQANHPNGDYIYFTFFETTQMAESYKNEYYHPVMMGLFLSIYAQDIYIPKWQVHGNIVAQYENPAFYEVFENLLKEK